MNSAQFYYLLRRGVIGGGGSASAFTGLLDTYSGAAAAYSLRQLSSTYTGDAIVVRRASDNTTQSIGFVNNELDTASLESFCSGTDGFVTTWYDQSGNGLDVAQSTASGQPKIVSAGSTITDGGKPAVDFNVGATSLRITTAPTYTQPNTIFSVFNMSNFNASNKAIFDGGTATSSKRHLLNINANQYTFFAGSVLTSSAIQSKNLTSAIFNTTSSEFYANGSLQLSGDAGSNSFSPIVIGDDFNGGNSYTGVIQEVVFYNSNESSNRTGIETNINTYYSIY